MKRYPQEKLDSLVESLKPVLADSPFAFVVLLGSASEGREFRDLDLAFYLGDPEADFLRLVLDWGHRLESAVGVPVDLVPLERASIGFQHQATKGQVLHCRDEQLLADWKERTWNRYFAMQPYFRQHARDLLVG